MKEKVTKITPRAMTLIEYDKFLDFISSDKLTKSKKQSWLGMVWILENVYEFKLEECDITPGTLMALADITIQLTQESEIDDLKNLGQSGTGK